MIDTRSIEIRRRVGPTAWLVFEELALSSVGEREACSASVSVRSLASRLGMSKDTVARALARLRAAGLVSASQFRNSDGTFAAGKYELHLPASIALEAVAAAAPAPPPAARARVAKSSQAQLVLAFGS